MMMLPKPANPLATFRELVAAAAPELQDVVVGDAPDNMAEPWAQIRGAGGPQGDKQCPEDYQRVDVNVYDKTHMRADLIAQKIFRALRDLPMFFKRVPLVNPFLLTFDEVDYETDVISVDAEGGPFQLVDTDRRVPFVFRSYVLFYGEDCNVSS